MRIPLNRVIFGFLAFFLILFVMWVGLPLLGPLYLAVSLLALREYVLLMNVRNIPIRKRSLWVATILTLPASLPVSYPGMEPLIDGVSWREALLGLFAFYLIALEVIKPNQNSVFSVIFTLFGYLYIPWLLGYVITLRYTPDGVLGLWYLMLPMLAIIASDVGAYLIGSLFGRRKLAPKLSPKKTLEGAFGGLGLATVVVTSSAYGLETWLGLSVNLYDAFLFSILVGSAAQLGDLFESLLKRWAGVKDTGTFLPGHGGILDRIDSVIFAVPVTYYFVALVILRG
jgi:phosphatidate cytidylyltransferase